MIEKAVKDSYTEQVHVVMSPDLNGYGRLYGGRLMEWIDSMAGIVARRHSGCVVTTVMVDTLQLKEPVYNNSTVVLTGRVTCVGNTSMEVRVDTYTEELCGTRKHKSIAYLILVALDNGEKPIPVPRLICTTPEEEAEFAAGQRRRQLRKQRLNEQF